jgi:hypothetical protein
MSSWAPTKYKTTNWSDYNDSLKRRRSLSIWFDPEMVCTPPPSGKRGRQQQFSDAAIQTCLTLKVLFGMPLRQTTGFVQRLLRLVGLDWATPDFSTLCRRQKTLNVSLPYRGSTGPLNLLIPSHRNYVSTAGQWTAQASRPKVKESGMPESTPLTHPSMCCRAKGGSKRRIWRKIHIGIDEETLEVRAIEVTSSNIGDAPMLPELPNQIPPDQDIGSVTADGAYDTRKCHEAIAARDAHAVIPPRKNAKPWKPPLVHAGMHCRAVDERWSYCPKRRGQCAAITGAHFVATLEWIPPPNPCRNQDAVYKTARPVADGQGLRPAGRGDPNPHNRYTALGIPLTEAVG